MLGSPRAIGLATLASLGLLPGAVRANVWGSFDASRVAAATREFNHPYFTMVHNIIQTHGGSVAPGTPELSPHT